MAQPTPYTRTTNFTDYSTSNPSNPQQGTSLDAEFNDIKTTTDQIRANLALLQRDDGDLKNASVHTEALSNAVLTLIKATANGYNVKGSWAASTAYAVGDLVDFSQATYLCFDAHTSGSTFSANSSKFILLANAAITSTASAVDTFNGDGSQTAFTLSNNAPSDGGVTEVLVFVNGQLRTPTTQYTISSNVITFSTAPSSGTGNVIVWGTSTVVEAAKTAAQTARDTAETYRNTSQDHRDTSESYAVETGGVVKHFSGASNGTSGTGADQTGVYSAKEHAVGTSVDTGSAKDWATKPTTQVASTDYSSKEWATGTSATSARSYAVKDDGVVTGTDYSAKAWAMSTDSDAPTGGSAKQWATNAGSAEVATGQGYSSKTYASDTTASASTTGGSAKGWSQTAEDTAVPGAGASDRSALHYREKAKDFATKTSGQVTGDTGTADQGYSAKEWAQGTQTRGAAAGGSARDWATYTSGTVDNSEYSAKYYATQAQTYAANAATSFDNFDDRYLGTNSSNPTNDNDGNALVTGALYFNTSDGEMRVYDGSSWIPASAAQNATILEYVYDITGSVTSIVGASGTGFAENNGAAVAFGSTESVHVYLNGVQLIEGVSDDYQLTPASNTVTFNSAVVSGDIVKIVVYKTFTVGDAVPASTGGTFSGNVAVNGDLTVDTDTLKVDSTGNKVGIGTNASDKLQVKGVISSEATNSTNRWLTYTHTDNTYRLNYNGAGNDEVVIDSSGNVAFTGDLTVDTNTLKVDSSNNAVLVGQTSGYVGDSTSASGLRMQTDGFLDVAKSGTYVMRVNRQSSDGEIVTLRKDGSSVGYIGTYGGDMTVGTGDTGIRFIDSLDCVVPVSDAAGTSRDNAVDLGYSSIRYKDLHLGGNVVIGSSGKGIDFSQGTTTPNTGGGTFTNTSSSHVLDQYERGYIDNPLYIGSSTFDSSSRVTRDYNQNASNRLYWEKIGQVVTISYRVDANPPKNAAGTNLSGTVRIKLPFTFNVGLAGSPTFVNNEQAYKATVYNGAWHPDAYVMYAYYAYGTEMRLVNNSQGVSLYNQNAGTRLILNFTATYLSN